MRSLLLLSTVFLACQASLFDIVSEFFGLVLPKTKEEYVDLEYDWLHPFRVDDYDYAFSKIVHVYEIDNHTRVFDLLAVTDMDKDAKSVTNWTWRAVTKMGNLTIKNNTKINITVAWKNGSDHNLTTHLNWKGRAMELSDLTEFNDRLLAPDDKTGMLYEIKNNTAIPWLFLNSGPGNTTHGMKAEWTTTKGSWLYVGGHGTEYRNENGNVVSEDAMWIKVINSRGEVRSINWKDQYNGVRAAANITEPGYLTHEAVQWSEIHKKWFFLPRKESNSAYNKTEDQHKGSNLLIIGDEGLENFTVVRIGNRSTPEHPERGYSAFVFLPETGDQIIVALKSEEVDGRLAESYITAFDINGTILLEDQKLEEQYKFEGIFFI